MLNTMVKFKMTSLPVLLAKQEGPAFDLMDLCRFFRKEVSLDAERDGKVKNGITSCFAPQTGSSSIVLPVID